MRLAKKLPCYIYYKFYLRLTPFVFKYNLKAISSVITILKIRLHQTQLGVCLTSTGTSIATSFSTSFVIILVVITVSIFVVISPFCSKEWCRYPPSILASEKAKEVAIWEVVSLGTTSTIFS